MDLVSAGVKESEVNILDPLGHFVVSENIHLGSGMNVRQYNLSELSEGIYFIKIKSENTVEVHRIIISR